MTFLSFRLLIIAVLTVLVIGSSPPGNETTSSNVEKDIEGEDVIMKELQEDYRNIFSHVQGFLTSLSTVMNKINQRVVSLETELRQSSETMKGRDAALLNAIQSELQQSRENRKTTDASLLTAIQRVEKAVTLGCITKEQNKTTLFEYDRHSSLKPLPRTGMTFNGSTLAVISRRIPISNGQGYSVTVEFANRLDSTIDSFQITQWAKHAVNLAPERIPGNTKEAFTTNAGAHWPFVAFSYLLPDPTLRIAVYGNSGSSVYGRSVGLAFLPSTVPISTYFNNPGTFGEYVHLEGSPTESEKTILAKKNGFIAKAILKDADRAIVRVELMEVPVC